MLQAQRHIVIINAVMAAQFVTTENLAVQLNVSLETVRRDLVQLEKKGALCRVHGGATGAPIRTIGSEEASYQQRTEVATSEKRAIGARAAALTQDGMTIAIDTGTTALEVARALPTDLRATVMTCSLYVAMELSTRTNVEVLVAGGRLRQGDLALYDALNTSFFADMHPDIVFLASGGVDEHAGLTDFHRDEIAGRRAMVSGAGRSYVLADSGKFGCVATHRVCDLADLTGVITGPRVAKHVLTWLNEAGLEVIS